MHSDFFCFLGHSGLALSGHFRFIAFGPFLFFAFEAILICLALILGHFDLAATILVLFVRRRLEFDILVSIVRFYGQFRSHLSAANQYKYVN